MDKDTITSMLFMAPFMVMLLGVIIIGIIEAIKE